LVTYLGGNDRGKPLEVSRNIEKGSEVQRFKGSEVQRFKGSEVQRFKGSEVQRFKGSRVQRFGGSGFKVHRSGAGRPAEPL
jgi:hypothetical protein